LENTVKTLIIVVIILIAVLGVASGFILQGYLSTNNNNKNATIVNQTNTTNSSTNNKTSNETTDKTTDSGFISDKKAISIAKPLIKSDPTNTYSAQLENGLSVVTPYYEVSAEYKSGGNWFNESTVVDVDAKTGKIITTWQAGGFDPLIPD